MFDMEQAQDAARHIHTDLTEHPLPAGETRAYDVVTGAAAREDQPRDPERQTVFDGRAHPWVFVEVLQQLLAHRHWSDRV